MEESDLGWDEIFVNPHAHAVSDGQQQGKLDGSCAGWNNGYRTGRITAIEYGVEIGYIRGVIMTIQQHLLEQEQQQQQQIPTSLLAQKNGTIQKSIRTLVQALDEFPSPDQIFGSQQQQQQHDPSNGNLINTTNITADLASTTNTVKESSGLDMKHKQDHIQACFKLLMVQLGLPNFSLKRIMDPTTTTTTADALSSTEKMKLHNNNNNNNPDETSTAHPNNNNNNSTNRTTTMDSEW